MNSKNLYILGVIILLILIMVVFCKAICQGFIKENYYTRGNYVFPSENVANIMLPCDLQSEHTLAPRPIIKDWQSVY